MSLSSGDIARQYRREARRMAGFFVRRARDPEIALDLIAETFASAIRDRDRFRGHGDEAAVRGCTGSRATCSGATVTSSSGRSRDWGSSARRSARTSTTASWSSAGWRRRVPRSRRSCAACPPAGTALHSTAEVRCDDRLDPELPRPPRKR
jgi:hypothetical protein